MTVSVSVCLYVRDHISENTHLIYIACYLHGRGSVFRWRRCDMLCTSGFMDDVMFAHNVQE